MMFMEIFVRSPRLIRRKIICPQKLAVTFNSGNLPRLCYNNRYENRILAAETSKKVGENITVAGWVHSRRDHGGLIFIDLRDHTGLVQLVINPDKKDAFSLAESLRDEFVVRACGVVAERGEGLKIRILPVAMWKLLWIIWRF